MKKKITALLALCAASVMLSSCGVVKGILSENGIDIDALLGESALESSISQSETSESSSEEESLGNSNSESSSESGSESSSSSSDNSSVNQQPPEDSGYLYNDFTASEKQLFIRYIGEVIPFVPNDEYYVEGYYDETDYENGMCFYTIGKDMTSALMGNILL